MPLDDLVQVIEILQQRIRDHGDSLRQNEIRTRLALIDPLLRALGWDVADPGLVTAEYDVSGQRADYALLKNEGGPAAFVEAKKLGESLISHRMQMVNYANMSGVPYAGLTDGNNWELYVVFDQKPLPERLVLDVSVANLPAYQCALKFLLLWRPNLASGQPVAAIEPILSGAMAIPTTVEPAINIETTEANPPEPASGERWLSISLFVAKTGSNPPTGIRFSDGCQMNITRWRDIEEYTAEWLWKRGLLTASNVPVSSSKQRYIVSKTPQHPSGNDFKYSISVTETPLFLEGNVSATSATANAKTLLSHCGQNAASVLLRVG